MVKLKALDTEMHQIGVKMAAMGSLKLSKLFTEFGLKTGFTNCHKKELAVSRQTHRYFADHVPEVYHTVMDERRELYLLVNERLENTLLKDSADDVQGWENGHIEEVLKSAASFHSLWFDKDHVLLEQEYYVERRLLADDYNEMSPLFFALLDNARNEFPEIIRSEDFDAISEIIASLPTWAPRYCRHPATLIHNDFNPRNITFLSKTSPPKAIIYDWELAFIAPPQRDIAEFLCFTLKNSDEVRQSETYVNFHRREMEIFCGRQLDKI